MTDLLANPVWHSLLGAHAGVAVGSGLARQYPRDMAPFSAIAEASPAAYDDLVRDLPIGVEARLFRPTREATPLGWEDVSARPILQMVLDKPPPRGDAERIGLAIKDLTARDAPAVFDLAAVAKPGPFDRRTPELGTFVGVFRGEPLAAMAGERFRLPGYVELSAIAVRPEERRRGLASLLVLELSRRALERNEIPFLHVFPENPAVAVYERLGFRTRTRLWVLWLRPKH